MIRTSEGPPEPKGPEASRIRQRKYALVREGRLPQALADMLPGSLTLSHVRCGKPTCHCATGEGHPNWTLTFMVNGARHVEHIPQAWVADIRKRVEAGRAFQDAVRDVLTANAELLILARKQRSR